VLGREAGLSISIMFVGEEGKGARDTGSEDERVFLPNEGRWEESKNFRASLE
jgi:hypothetical protein